MTNEGREYRYELWNAASKWASRITSSTGTGRIRFVRENKRIGVRNLDKDVLTGATFMNLRRGRRIRILRKERYARELRKNEKSRSTEERSANLRVGVGS